MESAPSITSTVNPARAIVNAAASPFGPEPTTMASARLIGTSQRKFQHVGGPDDRDGRCRETLDEGVHSSVATFGSVVEEGDRLRTGPTPELDGVVGRGMAE